MSEFDIYNDWTRPVVCVTNNDESWFPCKENAKLLTVGKMYTVINVDVHDWYTSVTLKEFPGFRFNSVLFEEIDEYTPFRVDYNAPWLRERLLVTAGARAAYMDSRGDIDIPGGLEGEEELAEFIIQTIDTFVGLEDVNFDLYIENELSRKFGGK